MNVKIILLYTIFTILTIYILGFFVFFDINSRVYSSIVPNSHDPKSVHKYSGPGPRYMDFKNMDWDLLMDIYYPVRLAFVYFDDGKITDDAPWK